MRYLVAILLVCLAIQGQAATVTFNPASGGQAVTITCTATVDCDDGSEAISPMISGDQCVVTPIAPLVLNSLTPHCQPYFDRAVGTYYVTNWDASTGRWLEANTVIMSAPASSGACRAGGVMDGVQDGVFGGIVNGVCD